LKFWIKEAVMAFVVRVLVIEPTGTESEPVVSGEIHADSQYEYSTLELAREAAQVACDAAAALKPSRSKATSDEAWSEHPDRSDAADV
jgi:hypothetical protein